MSAHALRPCPFCGGAAEVFKNGFDYFFAECIACEARTAAIYCSSTEAGAIRWNTRPFEQELLAACKLALNAVTEGEKDEAKRRMFKAVLKS